MKNHNKQSNYGEGWLKYILTSRYRDEQNTLGVWMGRKPRNGEGENGEGEGGLRTVKKSAGISIGLGLRHLGKTSSFK